MKGMAHSLNGPVARLSIGLPVHNGEKLLPLAPDHLLARGFREALLQTQLLPPRREAPIGPLPTRRLKVRTQSHFTLRETVSR